MSFSVSGKFRSWLAALSTAMVLAACGGGEPAALTPQQAVQRTVAQAAAVQRSAVPIATAAEQLMDYAETSLAVWFPGHKSSLSFGPFRFRYYPETNVFLAVVVTAAEGYAEGNVYVVGPPFGNTLDNPLNVGALTNYITPVDSGGGGNSLVVSAASSAARNATYAPIGAVFSGVDSAGWNGQTADGNFEMEVVWATNATIKRAHVWFFDSPSTIKFFGCDGGKAIPCTGISYEPLTQKITFTNVVWNEVNPDLSGAGPDQTVGGGEHLTLNGTIDAK